MTLLTEEIKKDILKKIKSGKYNAWLTEYKKKYGQHIILAPSDKAMKVKKELKKEIIPVRLPDIPRPGKKTRMNETFDKRGGIGKKQGRFVTINDPLMKVLQPKKKPSKS